MTATLAGQQILVTGGLGFIGHHFSKKLIECGARVTVVDDRSTNAVTSSYFADSAIVHLAKFRELKLETKFDWVCHLASPVGPTRVMRTGGEVGCNMVQDLEWLINSYDGTGAKILFVSSSEVYGVAGVGCETQDLVVRFPYSGRREYACAKLLAEIMLYNAHRTRGLPVLVIRPFNVVGRRQSAEGGFVIPRFLDAVRAAQPLTIYGDGSQRRCFTHVLDVAEAMIALMAIGANGTFNVANPENEITIQELAERLRIAIQKSLPGVPVQLQHVDPKDLFGQLYEEAPDKIADMSKFFAAVSWRPTRTIDDILGEVVAEAKASMENGLT
jgi:UDP-glucose 4-epimerase